MRMRPVQSSHRRRRLITVSSITVRPAARRNAVHSSWRNARTWLGSRRRSTSVMKAAASASSWPRMSCTKERAARPEHARHLAQHGSSAGKWWAAMRQVTVPNVPARKGRASASAPRKRMGPAACAMVNSRAARSMAG